MAPPPRILDSDSSSDDEAPRAQRPEPCMYELLASSSSSEDDEDAQDDGRQGHKAKQQQPPPPAPPKPAAAAAAAAAGKAKPAAVGKKRQKGAAAQGAKPDPAPAVRIKREKGTAATVPIKQEPPAAAAAAVKIKQKGAAAGTRKRPRAVTVKQEEMEAEESGEDSDGLGYDSFGDPIVDPLAKPGGVPKGESQLAEWRAAVARALLETTKEVKILDCVVHNLAGKLTGRAKETAEGQRAALEIIEDGKRAEAVLQALALLEGGASAASVLAAAAAAGPISGGGGDVWAIELPMQERDLGPPKVVLPSAAEIAVLRDRVERMEQAKREAKDRGLFKAHEQAPLAFAAAASGKVGVRAPDAAGAQSGLEGVLAEPLMCAELYGYLSTKDMGRLRQVSRLAKRDYDTEKYAKALRAYIDACKKEQRKAAAEDGQQAEGGAAAASGAWMARRQKQKRRARGKREPPPAEEAAAQDSSSGTSDKRRKMMKKKQKRARAASFDDSVLDSQGDSEGGGGDWDESLLEEEEEEGEGKGEGDLDAAVEEAITLGYQRKHRLGQGKLEVRKQAGSFHLHSEMATQARNNRDHAVRRKVEALLKPHALLLFPSEFDDGNGGSGSGSDDSDEEDEKPTALIQVRAQKRETRKEAPVRPKLAKGWDRKRVEAEAAKRISALVDLAAQLEFHKTRQKRLEEELKALRQQMRVLGSGVTTTVVGLGTVTVGEATVGAKQYRNKLHQRAFASLPKATREAILHTGLVVYQEERLVTTMGEAPRQWGESLLEVERKGAGHLPDYKNVRVLNAKAKAKAKAARGQQQG